MEEPKPPFNRRKFLLNAAKVAAVGVAGYVIYNGRNEAISEVDPTPPPPPESTAHEFLTKPYLQTTVFDTMNIRWVTRRNSYGWLEYGETKKLGSKAEKIVDGLVEANNRIHEITLTNLKPGKTYYYRVCSTQIKEFEAEEKISYGSTIYSDVYAFNTFQPQKKDWSWIILNDVHDRPDSIRHLFNLIQNEPLDFVFLNGDMFDYENGEKQIVNNLLSPVSELFAAKIPLLYVRGNHEMRGSFARELKNYFSFPHGQYYTYQTGPVFTVVLDSGEETVKHKFDYSDTYREQQAKWFETVAQTEAYKNAKFRVVKMHIPPQYSFDRKGSNHCKKLFTPLFNKHGVDVVFSGHTHVFGIHEPLSGVHNFPIVIGGGRYDGTRTVIKVKASEEQLTVKIIKDDGTVGAEHQIVAK
jgi:acid phosphatase type 7